jgi:hypothetical protein
MRLVSIVAAFFVLWVPLVVAKDSAYDVADAYEIYSLLLPHEESYGFAKGTLVIQQETVPHPTEECLTPEASDHFKDAVDNYRRLNEGRWLLQRRFSTAQPYEIVSSDTIEGFFKKGPQGWKDFYAKYPSSGGFITLSAVGFNKEKTQAVVYSGSSCGGLCGRWLFHLFEKFGGKWKEMPGVSCFTVS